MINLRFKPHRRHPLWFAFLLHRLSGLALALFLPVHFYTLALALQGAAELQGFLQWTQQPLLQLAEFILVFLLALHLFGGLRLLALEGLTLTRRWHDRQKNLAAASVAMAFLVAACFLLQLV